MAVLVVLLLVTCLAALSEKGGQSALLKDVMVIVIYDLHYID